MSAIGEQRAQERPRGALTGAGSPGGSALGRAQYGHLFPTQRCQFDQDFSSTQLSCAVASWAAPTSFDSGDPRCRR
jgi:hypothetical protein